MLITPIYDDAERPSKHENVQLFKHTFIDLWQSIAFSTLPGQKLD